MRKRDVIKANDLGGGSKFSRYFLDVKVFNPLAKSCPNNLVVWHDLINNCISSQKSNNYRPSSVQKLTSYLTNNNKFKALVYCQRTGTPDIFKGVVEHWDTGSEGDKKPDIETEGKNNAGRLQYDPSGNGT